MNLIFIDTETTGLNSDPYARLLQIAYKLDDKIFNQTYKPATAISIGAMSAHHITEAMVKDKPTFKDTPEYNVIKDMFSKKTNVFIAHNAPFDIEMFRREDIQVKTSIDTLKIARKLLSEDKSIKSYKLQNLRYILGVELPDARAHDAEGDVVILEAVFNGLMDIAMKKSAEKAALKNRKPWTKKEVIEYMIEITETPIQPDQRITFGKYSGTLLTELVVQDRQYCEWLSGQKNDDLGATLRYLLNRPVKK